MRGWVGGGYVGGWMGLLRDGGGGKGARQGRKVPVVPSSESSIHSWSWVYFFSRTAKGETLDPHRQHSALPVRQQLISPFDVQEGAA